MPERFSDPVVDRAVELAGPAAADPGAEADDDGVREDGLPLRQRLVETWFVLLMSLLFGMQSPKFHTNAPAPIDSLSHVFVGAALWSAPSL